MGYLVRGYIEATGGICFCRIMDKLYIGGLIVMYNFRFVFFF
jgi:hypothetical protein